jgi:hypothetical protein
VLYTLSLSEIPHFTLSLYINVVALLLFSKLAQFRATAEQENIANTLECRDMLCPIVCPLRSLCSYLLEQQYCCSVTFFLVNYSLCFIILVADFGYHLPYFLLILMVGPFRLIKIE